MRAAREPLIARLLAEPQRFEFFQAVHLLLLWLEEQGVPPRLAFERHLRFPNSLALAFPASEVEALEQDALPGLAAPQFRLTPGFMGLLGAHGTLPVHYTERIQAWQAAQADAELAQAPRAFLDMFSTRMLALFYGAWRKYRIEHAILGPRDAFLPLLLALAGLSPASRAPGVRAQALARYAGLLRQRPASAAVLARVLADHFGVGVAVLEGVGHWDPLLPGEQSRLGLAHGLLGQCAVLGARCWRPDLRVRVRIGLLDRGQFERFLPQEAAARALRTLLGLFATPTLSYEIVLVLRRDALGPIQLEGGGRRLGVDSYLLTGPAMADRADMRYEIRPMAPLPPLPSPPTMRNA